VFFFFFFFFPIMANARVIAAILKRQVHSQSTTINPWFLTPKVPELSGDENAATSNRQHREPSQTVPDEVPSYLKSLHSVLKTSPFLETSQLLVCRPLPLGDGPGLPRQRTRGTRRKRKQTFAGMGIDQINTLWDWTVYAQVKEGTENRGSIEAVVKTIRSTLQHIDPTLPIPRNRRQFTEEGWAMIDVGDVAIHVLSKAARHKYFGSEQWDA